MEKKFYTMNQNVLLSGVCSGLAYYFGIPTWAVRVATVVAWFMTGLFPVAFIYILLAMFVPEYKKDPEDYKEVCE